MKNATFFQWGKKTNPIAFLFFAGLLVLFYWRVLFDNQIFVFVDASRFFYPLWKWGNEALRQGVIPLWNPDAQFGAPYFADPQMAYAYPPVPLLYILLSPTNAFAALTIFHHFFALCGFWIFARQEGFSRKASLIGSLLFGFSLHLVCSAWTPVALFAISWIPWVFFAAEKVYRNEKNGFLYLSLAWAMQFSAGYPVLTYLTAVAVGLHFLWKTTFGKKIPVLGVLASWRWLLGFGAAGLTAITYNLVWGLPFLEMFRLSNYENGASRFHDLNWMDLATALSPFVQGHPLLPGYHGPHYWVSTYFVGLPALVLLLWGALHLVYKKTSWGIFPVLLVLSLGVLGLGRVLQGVLPGYNLVIHSGYWLSFLVFWAAWMAMESIEHFWGTALSMGKRWLWVGLLAGFYGISYLIKTPLDPFFFGLSLAMAGTAALWRHSFGRWVFLAAAVILSLGSAAFSLNILLDRSYYEKPPVTMSLIPKPGRIFFTPPLLKEAVLMRGPDMIQAYEGAKEKMYPDWPLVYGREETPIYNTIKLNDSFDWTFGAFRYSLRQSRNILNYLDIRYVFGKNDFKDFKKVSPAGNLVEISENPTPAPKWFSVTKAMAAGPSLEEDFTKANKISMDYTKACFISDPTKAGSYSSRPVSYLNKDLLLASGTGKGLIVSSETNYPGWKAWTVKVRNEKLELKRKPIEEINHAFRGIVLEDGEDMFAFSYEPVTFRLGLFFALAICGLWTGLLFKRFKN